MAAYLGLIDLSPRRLRVLRAEPTERRNEPSLLLRDRPLSEGLESLPEQLDALLDEGVLEPGRWELALSGELVACHRLNSPLKDLRKVRMTLDFELENALPFRAEEVVVSPLLRRGEEGTEIIAFATKRAVLAPLLELLHERRIEATSVVPSAFGLVQNEQVAQGRHLLLDIGAEQIDVVSIEEGELIDFASLPGGGRRVTESLQQSHLLDQAEAEYAKLNESSSDEGRAAMAPAVEAFAKHVQRALRGALRARDWREATITIGGGGACLEGLAERIEAELGLPVAIGGQRDSLTADTATACRLAPEVGLLRGHSRAAFSPINLRAGDLAHTTDVMKVLRGARPVAGWAAALLVLGLMQLFAGISAREARAERFEKARRVACAKIAGVESGGSIQCLAAMRETIAGTGAGDIPRFDAVDLLARISKAVPADLEVKIDEIRIDDRSLRLVGTTTGFQQSRSLVDALKSVRCIADLRSDKTVKKGERVMFSFSGRVDCSVEPTPASTTSAASTSKVGTAVPSKPSSGGPVEKGYKPKSPSKPSGASSTGSSIDGPSRRGRTGAPQGMLRDKSRKGVASFSESSTGDDDEEKEDEDEDDDDEDEDEEEKEEDNDSPSSATMVPGKKMIGGTGPNPYPNLDPFVSPKVKLPAVRNVMKLPVDDSTIGEDEE